MAIIKCKMCGGSLSLVDGASTAECEYCGSVQALPRVNDERLSSFYERANDLRMSHEFDKAAEIYEKIIAENPTDADAYWSMVLCQYGIDYVEETVGGVRKPTINRAQMVSVFEDVNYRSAIRHADAAQKQIYETEAGKIDRILQRYLEISRNEPAYDIFICYKETGENGDRTIDSVRAGEIYRELTAEGFKVFFAPVTLENKLGEDYEPYIFAAIHSAKIMIVIGTKPEYMNAVWVKNEWSRFLTLAKTDTKKTLIPVYSGMDPYDMPEAFRFKQSQNMEKLGFMLDLLRGIEKLMGRINGAEVVQPVASPAVATTSANADTLLQRAMIFIEDHDWTNADTYCEKALDIAPTNGKAYLYKLLIELQVTDEHALSARNVPFDSAKAYKNAIRYGDEATTARLVGYNQAIKGRLQREEEERQEQEKKRRHEEELRKQEQERIRREREEQIRKERMEAANMDLAKYVQELNAKKDKNLMLGVFFVFFFWPVSIYFFIKSFKANKELKSIGRPDIVVTKKIRPILMACSIFCYVGMAFMLLMALTEATVFLGVAIYGILGTMFLVLAKTPKGSKYILGKKKGMKIPAFVFACIGLMFFVVIVLSPALA